MNGEMRYELSAAPEKDTEHELCLLLFEEQVVYRDFCELPGWHSYSEFSGALPSLSDQRYPILSDEFHDPCNTSCFAFAIAKPSGASSLTVVAVGFKARHSSLIVRPSW